MSGHRFLPFLLACAFAAACGGGGGGGGSTPTQPPPPSTQPSATFSPAAAAGAGSLALAQGAASTATDLVVELRSGGVPDLYGVAFDLQFPANLLQLTSVTNQGSILATGTFQETHSGGNVVIGVSQLGLVSGVSGPGLVLRFEFKPLASGTGPFTFSRTAAYDSKGAPISGVSWIGGSVTTVVP